MLHLDTDFVNHNFVQLQIIVGKVRLIIDICEQSG